MVMIHLSYGPPGGQFLSGQQATGLTFSAFAACSFLQLFPVLKDRLKQNAGTLSGGEQQMLALGRALIPRPGLLLLDEPSLGLSPALISTAFERIQQVNKERGTAILIVEQKVRKVPKICHRVYGVKLGKIAFDGKPEELMEYKELRNVFL